MFKHFKKNTANAVTVLGVLLVLLGMNYLMEAPIIGATFLIAGMLCDLLDGFLARKLEIESELGAILDPLADKIKFFIVFYFVIEDYYSIAGILLLINTLIELAGMLARFIKNKNTKAVKIGKVKAFIHCIGQITAVICLYYGISVEAIMLICCFFSFLSLKEKLMRKEETKGSVT